MPSTFARKLRAEATEAEIRLWSKLRRKQLAGYRFRRQQPMGRYIVDFFCPEASLIVEVDGGQHVDEDPTREQWLKDSGYRVMRFWNNEVLANTEGVLETILDALRSTPKSESPPPLRGRVREGGAAQAIDRSTSHSSHVPPPADRSSRSAPLKGGGALKGISR